MLLADGILGVVGFVLPAAGALGLGTPMDGSAEGVADGVAEGVADGICGSAKAIEFIPVDINSALRDAAMDSLFKFFFIKSLLI